MKITKTQLRGIIKEELLSSPFRASPRNSKALRKKLYESRVYLAPTKVATSPRTISFGRLFEQCDAGILTESQAIKLWHRSVDYKLSQIDEGMMDALKSAYESTKSGAIKLKDKISDTAKAAWEKANDMFLDLSLQAMSIAQKSVESAVSATKKIWEKIQSFQEAHPVLFKIIVITLITILIFAVMSAFGSEAQAAVKMKGGRGAGGNMSETQYRLLRGALDEFGNSQGAGSDAMMNAGKAVAELDKAYKSSGTINMETMSKLVQGGQSMVTKQVKAMEGGNDTAFTLLKQWLKVGQSLKGMG